MAARWLLLIHHIPPKPGYLRAKAAKRLAMLGAVALKNAVYALPDGEQAREDLAWLAREIEDGGGKAFVVSADFLAGMDDGQARALFVTAREEDYRALLEQARAMAEELRRPGGGPLEAAERDTGHATLARLRRDAAAVQALDFFGGAGREALEGVLADIEARLTADERAYAEAEGPSQDNLEMFQGRTWVTRRGVHVDRMASAWLIRRFVDPAAAFRFIDGDEPPTPGEVRFDMLGGDFSHQGELCTFEVLLRRLGLADAGLAALAEIIHDLDLKDGRHNRPETAGVGALLHGITLREADDLRRFDLAMLVFDDLLAHFRAVRQARNPSGKPKDTP